jgi:hypothetical protein
MELTKEFAEELLGKEAEGWKEVDSVIYETNRHGTERRRTTYHNEATSKYVRLDYMEGDEGNGPTYYSICEVLPVIKEVTVYENEGDLLELHY